MSSDQPRLERFLEQAARAISGTQIHPVAVLQEVHAAAENGIREGSIPNRFRVAASPSEHARLTRIERQLRSGVERMLDELALRRSATRLGEWQVEFVASPSVPDGGIRVEASFAELAHRPETPSEALKRPTEVITRLSNVFLTLTDGSRIQVMHAPFFIGRAPGCDLVLTDLSISRRHAVIRKEPDGSIVMHDLESRNGLTVDGERTASVRLAPGVRLCLGDVELSVESGS
jgi:hypothetical protein